MILEIQTYPKSQVLRKIAEPVANLDLVQPIIDNMIDTLYSRENAVGLAANQIGELYRIIVFDIQQYLRKPTVIINPEIIACSDKVIHEEGCLSIPGFKHDVVRLSNIIVKGLDREGKEIQIEGKQDLTSIVLQHEMDHLDGILFIDHLSRTERKQFDKRFPKSKKKKN